jgi:hypothetical protein
MEPLDSIRAKIWNISLTYPMAIFGADQHLLIPIQTVIIDILETVAGMLLEVDVVGEDTSNFVLQYTKEYNEDGERVYGNVTGSQWFKRTQKAIQTKWGKDVHLLALNISSDKTQVTRLQKSLWPCYVTIMNLDGRIRRTNLGSEIAGYCPFLPYSSESMKTLLRKKYGINYGHNDMVKIIRKYLEQQFLSHLLKPIRDCRENGPIVLHVGRGVHQREIRVMPELMCYVCK